MGIATLLGFLGSSHEPISLAGNEPSQTDSKASAAFMEDKTHSTDTVAIEQKKADDIAEFNQNIANPHINDDYEVINIKGHYYYIFGDGILLPVDENWKEYIIPAAKDGSYEKISEYYLKEETLEKWTQKLTIHKINGFKDDCPEFAERLVNGILVTLSDRMALSGQTLTKDSVAFNYARKDKDDCILFWGMPGFGEVQFVRVFRSEYTNDLYLATSTYKMDLTAVTDDFAGDKMAELASIQQLKKRT